MKWSWRIGRVAGIDVDVHATFVILLGWVALSHYLARKSVADAFSGLVFIGSLFLIVVLHELGHALAARHYGIRTRDITLLPIGGVARLERMPDDPKQELLVALAGPAVNVALAIVLVATLVPAAAWTGLGAFQLVGGDFLEKMLWTNVVLAAFNLIPAFPMDGGRALRALLAMRLDYVRATHIAASIGQGLALIFGFVGLFWNPFLVFIALFVWMGAAGESSMVQMKSALGGIPVSRALISDFRALSPDDSLETAVEQVLAGFQHDFPVVQDGRLGGVLTRKALLAALAQKGQASTVRQTMETKFETADPAEMLESVFIRLQDCGCQSLAVVRGERLVGLLTMENIGEFVMIQSVLRGTAPSHLPQPALAK